MKKNEINPLAVYVAKNKLTLYQISKESGIPMQTLYKLVQFDVEQLMSCRLRTYFQLKKKLNIDLIKFLNEQTYGE